MTQPCDSATPVLDPIVLVTDDAFLDGAIAALNAVKANPNLLTYDVEKVAKSVLLGREA
jgi:hypothetical protein